MANPQCTYPACGIVLMWTEAPDPAFRESQFCTKHIDAKCNYPPCQDVVTAGSDICETHQGMVKFFDWIHSVRHNQQMQQVMAQQQGQKIHQRLLGANGKTLNLQG